MRTTTIDELRERTLDLLKEVQQGEQVRVVHEGQTMAELIPPRENSSQHIPSWKQKRNRVVLTNVDLSKEILKDREHLPGGG